MHRLGVLSWCVPALPSTLLSRGLQLLGDTWVSPVQLSRALLHSSARTHVRTIWSSPFPKSSKRLKFCSFSSLPPPTSPHSVSPHPLLSGGGGIRGPMYPAEVVDMSLLSTPQALKQWEAVTSAAGPDVPHLLVRFVLSLAGHVHATCAG